MNQYQSSLEDRNASGGNARLIKISAEKSQRGMICITKEFEGEVVKKVSEIQGGGVEI